MQHHENSCEDCDVAQPARPSLPRQTGPSHRDHANSPDSLATEVVFVRCPECDGIASVEWQSSAVATSGGPVGHAKVRCVTGHWFLLPTAWLTAA